MTDFIPLVATELGLASWQVAATANLLAEEATIPFIARYRKEVTGGLDEVQATSVRDRLKALAELEQRREAIVKSLAERELLTDELAKSLSAAATMAELEDLYLPFRPKRRTRALMAMERGLGPLAESLFAQDPNDDPLALAAPYVDLEKNVPDPQAALAGARDILAEKFSEDATARQNLRNLFEKEGLVKSLVAKGKEEAGQKYADYFDFQEPVATIASHRYLAIRRGEAEGILSLSIQPDPDKAVAILLELFHKNDSPAGNQVAEAIRDSWRRLISPSLETEIRLTAKKKADLAATAIFSQNLGELLMEPPLGEKAILAIDPGFRTGCKTVALGPDGRLLEYVAIQPHASEGARQEAAAKILGLVYTHNLTAIAIGNGTAGRETEAFVRSIENLPDIPIVMVNESGASIYSASEEARREFPDLDLTFRGAISIGRRLMDPLAELVKIDPKSIGVGQYQHDVDQALLKNSLDDVVVSCVNKVGVEANTASEKLLSYVSGLSPTLAKNFVKFRSEKGPFKSREDFRLVPRLGPKTFEQCAGFLRLNQSSQALDKSAVHPESYWVVEKMALDLEVAVLDLLERSSLRAKIKPQAYVSDRVGLPTLLDIMAELEKPGRDPRRVFRPFSFAKGLEKLEDLSPGLKIPGRITNVTAFGAFVDVGVHQDGLIHLSEMADHYVRTPTDVVRLGQEVMVTVLGV
ncbi:MAG: RNA-binding transcriptional accessory protein, partial [Deltaproteobacteria bacterium]|nr:RNA-binding transcriptional accessory protein [Deltaproteobacteria bacterium]